MSPESITVLRRLSLRKALWQARMAARTLVERVESAAPERRATAMLRSSIRAEIQDQPAYYFGECTVYPLATPLQAEVLQRDPEVVRVASVDDLLEMLAEPGARELLAGRDLATDLEGLRRICQESVEAKRVYLEV